jgi:hypothetical protein
MMSPILKIFKTVWAVPILLMLFTACSEKSEPLVPNGEGGLRFVESSNILDNNKELKILGRTDTLVFELSDLAEEVTVVVKDQMAGGLLVPVLITVDQNRIEVVPVGGVWNSQLYDVQVSAMLSDGTPVVFTLTGLARELGLFAVSSNIYNVEQAVGYSDVPRDIDFLIIQFDEDLDRVENLVLSAGGVSVATQVTLAEDSVYIDPQLPLLAVNTLYTVSFTAFSENEKSVIINWTFRSEGNALVPVKSNVQIANSEAGSVTTNFPIASSALWVVFSEELDPDPAKIVWRNAASAFGQQPTANLILQAGGTAANINASFRISADTLFVTPNASLAGVKNGDLMGFRAVVTSLSGQNYEVDAWAGVAVNDIYVVSTNVRNQNGLYKAFKVIGDSLVVQFSKAVVPDSSANTRFRVNNFVADYRVTWSADSLTATIKNVDTLNAATYTAANPYQQGSVGTLAYNNLTFSLTAADGEETTVSPVEAIEVHTEYGLALVNSNLLHKHLNSQTLVTASEQAMDTLAANGNITLEFNRALDTVQIKAAPANQFVALIDGANFSVKIPIRLRFSADARTLTIDPEEVLLARKSYYLRVMNVPGAGISGAGATLTHSGRASGLGALLGFSDLLSSDPFKIYYQPTDISGLSVEVTPNQGVGDSTASPALDLVNIKEDNLEILLEMPAWNKRHNDSVDAYEYRVRRISPNGIASGWYYSNNKRTTAVYDTSVFAGVQSGERVWNINLSGESFISNLQTIDKGTGYSNGDHIFNDSARIEVQVRAVLDDNGDGDYLDAGEFGPWSDGLVIADNTAPCDDRRVATVNMDNVANGGVDVSVSPTPNGTLDRTGEADDAFITVTLNFPEDMDVNTTPGIDVWYAAGAQTDKIVRDATQSGWTSGRQYRFYLTLEAGIDYSGHGAYYAVDVSGVKDASGVVIRNSGSIGDAADGISEGTADNTEEQGSINVAGLQTL